MRQRGNGRRVLTGRSYGKRAKTLARERGRRELRLERLEKRCLMAADVTSGLVGHWMLEETAIGQSVLDSSVSGNSGVHRNLASPSGPSVDAIRGVRSLNLDGTNDYVSIGPASSLALTGGKFTQSLWIKSEQADNGYHGILGFESTGPARRYPSLFVVGQNRIHGGFGDGTTWHNFTTGSVLPAAQWNHIAATFDGTIYTLFVNGQSVFNTTAFAGKVPYPTQQLDIGRVDNYFRGKVDDVRVYSRALTQEDVTAIYSQSGSDTTLPTAALSGISTGSTIDIPVTYSDNLAINVATIDGNDLRITGPGGFDQLATLRSVDSSVNGTPRVASYQIAAPPVAGTYQVTMLANQVVDTTGNAVAAGALGSFVITSGSTEPDPTGLVGHWRLEESAIGQSVLDGSGQGNNGTHVNMSVPSGPSNSDPAQGQFQLSFDGLDDHVSVAPSASLNLSGGKFTQSLWLKPEHTDEGYHGILGYATSITAQRYPSLYVVGQTKVHGGFGDGTTWHNFTTSSVLNAGQWNHLVATFDGTTYRLYANGQNVFSTTSFAGKIPYPTQQLDIGRMDNYFKGSIDEVRIYSRALTEQEVAMLYGSTGTDAVLPTATVTNIARGTSIDFTVVYADNVAVDVSTLDNADLRVTGPGGFSQLASFVSVNPISDGTPRTAVYRIAAPSTFGTYQASMEPNQVSDTSDNFVISGALTSFDVSNDLLEPDSAGLIGRWKFEESAIGQTVVDVSGQSVNGTHVNMSLPSGPDSTQSIQGAFSLRLDGVDDYVSVGPDARLNLSGGRFTQSVWLFPDHLDTGYHGILGLEGNVPAQRYPSLYVVDQSKIHGGFGDGTTWNSFTTDGVLNLGQWNHVASTFDGVVYTLYVNGEVVFQSSEFAGKTPYPVQEMHIGRVDNNYRGSLDDIRLYSRALNESEVGLLYLQNSPEAGTLQMADREYTVVESDGLARVEVIRTGGARGEVTVNYITVDGSATSPSDFAGGTGVLTFADGEISRFIEVPLVNDTAAELNESFSVSLAAAGGGAGLRFPRTRLINVVDDDAPVVSNPGLRGEYHNNTTLNQLALVRTDATINFNWGSGSPNGAIAPDTFSVRWTGFVESKFSERYTFHATTDDGVRVWVNGQKIIDRWVVQSSRTVTGSIDLVAGVKNSIIVEYFENTGNASAILKWSSPRQALQVIPQSQFTTGSSSSGPVFNFAASSVQVDEGSGSAQLTVLRLGSLTAASSVGYAVSSGSATAGADYTSVSGTLSFAVGESSKTITVPILEDGIAESFETLLVTLQNPVGGNLGLQKSSEIVIQDNDPGSFNRETVIDNLVLPVTFEWGPGGNIYVAQKEGQVLVYGSDGTKVSTFIDISAEVNDVLDRGLIGFTLHPQFPAQPYAYLLYVYDPPETAGKTGNAGPDGNGNRVNRLVRVTADAATNYTTAIPGSQLVILGKNSTWENISSPDKNSTDDLTVPPSCGTGGTLNDCIPVDSLSHAAGTVRFSQDGTSLFVSIGDGTSYGTVDPRTVRVQDLNSLSGKVLRIDPVTGNGLPDNPFFNGDETSNRSRVYSYGLRNPFRFTLHPETGEPFIGDVGWAGWEEINTGRGSNFGWPYYEGGSGISLQTGGYKDLQASKDFYASSQTVQASIYARAHADGAIAQIMGDFYTGSTFPTIYQGALFFSDISEGSIDYLTFDQDGNPEPVRNFATGVPNIVHMATGPDGNLYFTNIAGKIERFVPTQPLSGASAFAASVETVPPSEAQRLDVNGDGSVSALDALTIVNLVARDQMAASESVGFDLDLRLRADVNGDQRVSALDAIRIVNYLARLEVGASAAIGNSPPSSLAAPASDLSTPLTLVSDEEDDLLTLLAEDSTRG